MSAIAMGGVGGVISAYGAYRTGEANRAAYEYDARINDLNARITHADTQEQVARQRQIVRRHMGAGRAAAGASGVALSGSALYALADSAAQGELDALTIKHEGQLKELGYQLSAQSYRMAASNAHAQGVMNASAKLLGAGANYETAHAQQMQMA